MGDKARVTLAGRPGPISRQIAGYLTARGWEVLDAGGPAAGPLAGMIFDAGLLDGESEAWSAALPTFHAAVRDHLPLFADRADGGARVVVLGSRDWLGAPAAQSRPRSAAALFRRYAASRWSSAAARSRSTSSSACPSATHPASCSGLKPCCRGR